MNAAEVPDELVEIACRARWEAEGSVFTGHNGDVAYTWDALAALFPVEADVHRRRERAALAAVLPLAIAMGHDEAAQIVHAERRFQAELAGRRSLGAEYTEQRMGVVEATIEGFAARLRAAETERTS